MSTGGIVGSASGSGSITNCINTGVLTHYNINQAIFSHGGAIAGHTSNVSISNCFHDMQMCIYPSTGSTGQNTIQLIGANAAFSISSGLHRLNDRYPFIDFPASMSVNPGRSSALVVASSNIRLDRSIPTDIDVYNLVRDNFPAYFST
jgi:hypothetical protein